MSRRSTPERIDQARRAATRNRLIGERVSPDLADARIAAWEAQAAEDGLERGAAYWRRRAGTGSPSSGSVGRGQSKTGSPILIEAPPRGTRLNVSLVAND